MLLRVDAWVPLHQCGTEVTSSTEPRRAEGLLTERGGSHPGSADEAAENPERERCCPAACSQRHHHPSPLGQRILQSSLQRCSPPLRGVLERNWSVLRCKRKPSSSCFLSSPLTRSGFQFWAGSSSKGGAVLLSPPCGSGLLLWEPVKCQGKKFKPRRNRRGEREEGTDTYPALSSGKKNITKGRVGEIWRALSLQERTGASYVSSDAAVATAGGRALLWPLGSRTQRGFQ